MTDTTPFRSDLRRVRPDAAARIDQHRVKRKLALALRALRKGKGMTQKDVERESGLSQPMISRIESPSGPLPNWETVMRYVAACGGHMLVGFSDRAFDATGFVESHSNEHEVVSAVAV